MSVQQSLISLFTGLRLKDQGDNFTGMKRTLDIILNDLLSTRLGSKRHYPNNSQIQSKEFWGIGLQIHNEKGGCYSSEQKVLMVELGDYSDFNFFSSRLPSLSKK